MPIEFARMPSPSEILDTIPTALSGLDYIQGIGLGGSRGRGTATEQSDIDLFVLIPDAMRRNFDSDCRIVVERHFPVVAHARRGFVEGSGFLNQLVLEDATVLDISAITDAPELPFGVQPTMRILYQQNDALAELMYSARAFSELTDLERDELLENYIAQFLVFSILSADSLRKHQEWVSVYSVERLRSMLFTCLRLYYRSYTPFIRRGEDNAESVLPAFVREKLSRYNVTPDRSVLRQTHNLLIEVALNALAEISSSKQRLLQGCLV